jgi:hypothetical protein
MMAEHSVIGATARDRFMQAVQNEMARFERREIEFRKKDRAERAAELRIPIGKDETNTPHEMELSQRRLCRDSSARSPYSAAVALKAR